MIMESSVSILRPENDQLKELVDKLKHGVNERNPRLVLSVVGDSSSFVPKPWLTPVFQHGLIETATGAKDCLILYKGSNEKVSSLVHEAVDNFRVMNSHRETDNFISLVGVGSKNDSICTTKAKNATTRKTAGSKDKLCVNETYYRVEAEDRVYRTFQADLLERLSKEYVPFVELGNNGEFSMKIPVLAIVVEGDLETVDHVTELLKRKIPILLLKGSGKAADLIADCLEEEELSDAKITGMAPLLFGICFRNQDLERLKGYLREIQNHRHFVNIFDINTHDETEFSDAVVKAIIKAWAQSVEEQERPVKSAIGRSRYVIKTTPEEEKFSDLDKELYNDTDYGPDPSLQIPSNFQNHENGMSNGAHHRGKKNSIKPATVTSYNVDVKGEMREFMNKYQDSLTPASLPLYFYIAYQFIQEMQDDRDYNFKILLKQAIVANRVDYVTVLLQEKDVKFDMEHFPYLYYKTISCTCSDDYYKTKSGVDGDCQHIWSILKSASEDSTKRLAKKPKDLIKPEKKKHLKYIMAARQLCQKLLHYPRKKYEKKEINKDDDCYHDLLIWSLFANRQDLASLFWLKCKNQLETAVLASCVLKQMAAKAKSGKDQALFNSIKEHSELFERRSLDLQTKLYEEDADIAMDLMLTEDTVWDIKVSPLECAFDNALLDFIAHSCAQRRLNKIWYKKIGASLWDFWKNGFFCGCKSDSRYGVLIAKFFYAPLTRFILHYILFIGALVCYSAFLLIELEDFENIKSMKIYEWLIYIWLLGDIIEEYRGILPWNEEAIKSRFSQKDSEEKAMTKSIRYRLKRHFYDFWNFLDFFSYTITIGAILVRFLYKSTTGYSLLARRLYSLSLATMYMRFLHAVLMSRKLGPKIIMIKEMLKELFRFIGILFVFMMGVGVLYHANMYPAHYDMWNTNGWTYWRIWKIMYIPYWQIYGDAFLDSFEDNSTTPCTNVQSEWESNPDIERCSRYDWVLVVIAALYMLLSNLLLVNLVIALFTHRFEIVQSNSERLWRYWRYAVIMDYRSRVPAPLNLVVRPFMTIYKLFRKCCCNKKEKSSEEETNRMKRLQDISANKCERFRLKNL